jgi:hypothetical protein
VSGLDEPAIKASPASGKGCREAPKTTQLPDLEQPVVFPLTKAFIVVK